MIALGIRYLTGYVVAKDSATSQPEWPPHIARVFMALAAAHFENGATGKERSALEWLEAAEPPAVYASAAHPRSTVETFVPVNDTHGGIFNRSRQSRTFHRARLEDDTVFLLWNADPPSKVREAFASLCQKVTRIGHSSSLVQMWLLDGEQVPECNWIPSDSGSGQRLRVPVAGTLLHLESAFNKDERGTYVALEAAIATARGRQKKELKEQRDTRFPGGTPPVRRPQITSWRGYVMKAAPTVGPQTVSGPFDPDFIVLTKTDGNELGLESTLQLTGALRNASMKAAGDNPPEWLTGHTPQGSPSLSAHIAFFPLPYVGFENADGHVMGLGLAVPRSSDSEEVRRVLGSLLFRENGEPVEIHLWRSGVWRWTLERETRERAPLSLQRRRWDGPSRTWGSVTPLVLHHHPKPSRGGDVERIVQEAFASALLPVPEKIHIKSVSAHTGAGHVRGVPVYEEGGANLCRYQVHAVVGFSRPVQGPVLVGRGRFRGYGLFAPMSDEEVAE